MEPTHTDDDGVTRPGSTDLKTTLNPSTVADIETLWRDHVKNYRNRNAFSSQFPNISTPYADLQTLIGEGYMRFGNQSIDTLDASVVFLLMRFANRIVEDIRFHPYSDLPDLDYYKSLTDTRPIPDEIMISGLAFHYAKWKHSERAKLMLAEYTQALNQILYQRKFGSGKIQMAATDTMASSNVPARDKTNNVS